MKDLIKISEYANKDIPVENVACLIDAENLMRIHKRMNGKKAVGVDKVTRGEYESNIDSNLENLVKRMKNQSYKPLPSKRVYIEKPGSNKKRPLGISSYEDKLVEARVSEILTAIYEPKFYEFSYGFRPNRNCHQAIIELRGGIQKGKISYIVEADLRSFFDTMSHEWIIKFLEHDVSDKRFIQIVRNMLEAGIMDKNQFQSSEIGSPQGNGASPIIANVYLHYVLDMWFDRIVAKYCKGECYMVRYADDYVCCFQYETEARWFYQRLIQRLGKYGLEIAEEKTRIMEFGRFAKRDRSRKGLKKPETFQFLGFTFYCSESRNGKFSVKLKSSSKKTNAKLKQLGLWLKKNRHLPLKEIIKRVNLSLRGHYRYYGVSDNIRSLHKFEQTVKQRLFYWLNHRSQKKSYTWEKYCRMLHYIPLEKPQIYIKLYV